MLTAGLVALINRKLRARRAAQRAIPTLQARVIFLEDAIHILSREIDQLKKDARYADRTH